MASPSGPANHPAMRSEGSGKIEKSLLQKLETICDEIFERWDKDQRAGKLLTALAGRIERYRSDVTEIRDALRGWQPIDTAPKDGTEILVWWPQYRLDDEGNLTNEETGGARIVAQFLTNDWQSGDPLEGIGEFFGDDSEYGHEPTLWCPIPEKPNAAIAQATLPAAHGNQDVQANEGEANPKGNA